MGEMRDSDCSRQILLRSDWLLLNGAIMTTKKSAFFATSGLLHIAQQQLNQSERSIDNRPLVGLLISNNNDDVDKDDDGNDGDDNDCGTVLCSEFVLFI